MESKTLELFKTLTEFPSIPGHERELRAWVKERISGYTDEIVQDRLGSLFGVLRGQESGPRVMVAGHLDEVGFIVNGITETGMIRFQPVGGWWSQAIMSQRLQVLTPKGPVIGVVGSVSPHLLDESQRSKPMDIKHMYLDIGVDSRQEAQDLGIVPGTAIAPICDFTPLANPKKLWLKHGITATV